MTGGLMQLVGKGAQDQLIIGNPSFTHFRSVYKRHTDFAMEHFRLHFKTTNLNIPQSGSLTLRTKVERYAQLLHDCYLNISLPAIYSPVYGPITPGVNPNVNASSTAVGYEFQWIRNIGYNMINYVSIIINGQEIVRHTGEWMKLYATLKFDKHKKEMLNRLVGNVPELYDPGNANGRLNQYPHSISNASGLAEPSIPSYQLQIPLHFWFCEQVGSALPLVALQYSEVEIIVDLKNIYQLFTTLEVRETAPPKQNFGLRIAPDSSASEYQISHFLSPPTFLDPKIPVTPNVVTWNANPFIEANYVFLSDVEMAHIAKTDHSFVINQVDVKELHGQYGPSNDMELTMRNLCSRVVWVGQRSDRALQNDYDNYTNWENHLVAPLDNTAMAFMTSWYSSGISQGGNVSNRDILLESNIILDGKERFSTKQTTFFSHLQHYKHHTGSAVNEIPGIYTYSFALDHHTNQPSGHINGSMFNKTILRNTYVQPPLTANAPPTSVCILKSTAQSPNPTVVNPNAVDEYGRLLYKPSDVLTIIRKADANVLQYTYHVRAYTESYNYLRVLGGIANVVFSS